MTLASYFLGAGTSSQDPLNYFFQLGVLGVIFILNMTGFLWVKPSVERLFQEIDRLRTRNEELEKLYNEQMYPFMLRQAEVLNLALQQLQHQQRDPPPRRSPAPRRST